MVDMEFASPGASGDVESRQEAKKLVWAYHYTMIVLIFGVGIALGLALAFLMKVYG